MHKTAGSTVGPKRCLGVCFSVEVDPRRLLVFREVGRAGSLAGAARALGWTQPAVSQHVRRLEADSGTPLVVRAGRGVALTEAGRALMRHADAGYEDAIACAREHDLNLPGIG